MIVNKRRTRLMSTVEKGVQETHLFTSPIYKTVKDKRVLYQSFWVSRSTRDKFFVHSGG